MSENLISVCSWCGRWRRADWTEDFWAGAEVRPPAVTETHGICPACEVVDCDCGAEQHRVPCVCAPMDGEYQG